MVMQFHLGTTLVWLTIKTHSNHTKDDMTRNGKKKNQKIRMLTKNNVIATNNNESIKKAHWRR